tara:strand:- start:4485 stop:5660 length:1176 start_codon:yes stop_codon:yes gene_type:complete
MPILKQSASDAIRTFKHNSRRTNHLRDGDVKAEDRFMLAPVQSVSHRLRAGESIFTIGSCFARNVERHLDMMGFDVINRRIYDEAERLAILPGIDNRYTPFSMLNEFRWALDPDFRIDYEAALYKVDRGLCFDPHMHYAMRRFPVATALERRDYLNECNRSITRCQTIIMTLGLAEAWWDSKLGLYLNWSPQMRWIEQEPHRFEFHLLGPEDVCEALESIYALLDTHGHPDFQILLTVSPIEMMATFRPMDASVANMHSKSILRAAAGAFVEKHQNVDYLPSFEIALLSDPWAVWAGDRVHIQDDAVDFIVRSVMAPYLADEGDVQAVMAADSLSERSHQKLFRKQRQLEKRLERLEMEKAHLETSVSNLQRSNTNYLRQILELQQSGDSR